MQRYAVMALLLVGCLDPSVLSSGKCEPRYLVCNGQPGGCRCVVPDGAAGGTDGGAVDLRQADMTGLPQDMTPPNLGGCGEEPARGREIKPGVYACLGAFPQGHLRARCAGPSASALRGWSLCKSNPLTAFECASIAEILIGEAISSTAGGGFPDPASPCGVWTGAQRRNLYGCGRGAGTGTGGSPACGNFPNWALTNDPDGAHTPWGAPHDPLAPSALDFEKVFLLDNMFTGQEGVMCCENP